MNITHAGSCSWDPRGGVDCDCDYHYRAVCCHRDALEAEVNRLHDEAHGRILERDAAVAERDALRRQLESARTAARALLVCVGDLGALLDDNDPRIMATADPMGAAEADLFVALGLDINAEHARQQADIDARCAVCGWTLAESDRNGCVRGNCSYRPRPKHLYAPERAKREAEELRARKVGTP